MAFDEQGNWIMTPQSAMDAWRTGVNEDIHLGQTATTLGAPGSNPNVGQAIGPQVIYNTGSTNSGSASPQTTAPPNPAGQIGNPAGDFIPQATDPSTGSNPTATTGNVNTQQAPDIPTAIKNAIASVEQWGTTALIFLLGLLLIGAGLFLFAKETNIGKATGKALKSAVVAA